MKKNLLITLLVSFLTLCLVLPGYGKGELGDNDAFSTYMGKTRSEVRLIAPIFDEFDDNLYVVDFAEEDGDIFALAVMFDEYNLVQSVIVMVTKGAMKILDLDDSIEMAASLGILSLGFTSDSVIKSQLDKDGDYIINIKGGITVLTTQTSEQGYMVISMQK